MSTVTQALPKGQVTRNFLRINAISNPSNPINGAIKLPSDVKSLQLIFKKKNFGGHMGLRKFWQNYLPTLQFYNPSVKMTVQRISLSEGIKNKEEARKLENDLAQAKKCPSKIIVELTSGSKKELNCKEKHSESILEELQSLLGATKISEKDLISFKNPEATIIEPPALADKS